MPAPPADFAVPSRRPRRVTFVFALALLTAPVAASADDKAAPAKTGGNSIEDGFRSLGQQISDPRTVDRIKGHEQEFEKNVQGTRDQQRRKHPGELRASDATGMANDPKMGGGGATKSTSQTAPRPKASPARTKKADDKSAAPAPKADGGAKPPPAPAPGK